MARFFAACSAELRHLPERDLGKVKYGRLEVSEAKQMKGLGSENAGLKKIPADATLDNVAPKDRLAQRVTPAAKREAVAHLRCASDTSEQQACRITGSVWMTVRYRSHHRDDADLRASELLARPPPQRCPHC
ncbi:MAG: hypothetical protein IRY89_12970 [Pseudolabrys sp.]|nr:hypothetical protein [Pseudolabrys sp.]